MFESMFALGVNANVFSLACSVEIVIGLHTDPQSAPKVLHAGPVVGGGTVF